MTYSLTRFGAYDALKTQLSKNGELNQNSGTGPERSRDTRPGGNGGMWSIGKLNLGP